MRTASKPLIVVAIVFFAAATGCSTVPKEESARVELRNDAETTLDELKQSDPTLDGVLDDAEGYVVFPSVGKGGFIVGGGYGRGTLYEDGQMVGYADITQAALGALIGGQSFAELIVFQSAQALEEFKGGDFTFGANANAVALESGTAASTSFADGVAVFTRPNQGLMAEASLSGQKFRYVPTSEVQESPEPSDVATARDETSEARTAGAREEPSNQPTTQPAD